MSFTHRSAITFSLPIRPAVLIGLVLISFLYVHGWYRLKNISSYAVPGWRLASFLFGMSLIWATLGSALATYDHHLLTVHMIQHLLLMTFAPALILLGEPLLVFWHELSPLGKVLLRSLFQRPFVRGFARMISRPMFCWTVSIATLIGWHMPALFALGMRSHTWHSVEQASFLVAGFLFWWPVIPPWPSNSKAPQWWTLLYLFLATLPCDILSGFLAFSDRVVYPMYFSMPRHFGLSPLEDQQLAAALMWSCVTIAYAVPAAILSVRLLLPQGSCSNGLVHSEAHRSTSSYPMQRV
jgi:putative membrane protein